MHFYSGFPQNNIGENIFAMVFPLRFAREELAMAELTMSGKLVLETF